MVPDTIAGFHILPVTYSGPIEAIHYFYIRAHETGKSVKAKGKFKELPENRTLFVVNVPPDATEREFSLFFKGCGIIERVVFNSEPIDSWRAGGQTEDDEEDRKEEEEELMEEDESSDAMDEDNDSNDGAISSKKKRRPKPPSKPTVTPLPPLPTRTLRRAGQTAHIIFLDESSLKRAISLPSSTSSKRLVWPPPNPNPEPSGLAYYEALYDAQHPPLSVVREHADTYMEAFEFEQAQKQRVSKYKKGDAVVDEDGFTLVTRGGAYGKTLGGGVGVASKKFGKEVEGKKKKKNKEKEKFYTFQVREQKRKEYMDLRKNFEEDKRKVAELRKERRFKPY